MGNEIKIIAKVKFNQGFAYILSRKPELVYNKIGSRIIYGTDGLFYKIYHYERADERWQAFAGRKFDLTMGNGEVIHCAGDWWDGGYNIVESKLNIKICSATIETLSNLKKCFVFTGYNADAEKYKQLIDSYKGITYGYWDYEALIKGKIKTHLNELNYLRKYRRKRTVSNLNKYLSK